MKDSTESSNDTSKAELSQWQCASLALPALAVTFFMGPIGVLQGIYAKHFGIALTTIAAVLLVSRLFDAITDPLIAYISDRYRLRTGTRKPFIFVGLVCLIPCGYFLYVPPEGIGVVYFTMWSLAFYLACTVFHIPHLAWASEVTSDPEGRSAVFSWFYVMAQLGAMLFYFIPFLPLFPSTAITPETLKVCAVLGAFLILPCLYLSLRFTPNGREPTAPPAVSKKPRREMVRKLISAFWTNRPFVIYVLASLCSGLAFGMWGGLIFIYIDSFLGLGELFSQMALAGIVASIVITPLFFKLSIKFGKKRTWLMSAFLLWCGVVYTGLMRPGDAGMFELMIVQTVIVVGSVGGAIVGPAILSDVIDFGLLKEPVERNALYFSVQAFLSKTQGALGMALGLGMAGWFGYDAAATVHDESSAFGIILSTSWIPSLIALVGIIFVQCLPLNERRNAIVRRRLDARCKRASQEREASSAFPKHSNPAAETIDTISTSAPANLS